MNLKAGDVLSTDCSGTLTVLAVDVPVFRGAYGHSRGQHAVKVSSKLQRGRMPFSEDVPRARPAGLIASLPTHKNPETV